MRLVVLAGALLSVVLCGSSAAEPPKPCEGTGAHVFVSTGEHRLFLCEGATEVRSFGVRLARRGVGKSKAGDEKVPVGRYDLGVPRASKSYGTFIPIGYPTAKQRQEGYTGGSIGVHGPDRRVAWLGRLVNFLDTTEGCIGIGTDAEMEAIASWVRKKKAAWIEIE